MTDPTGSLTRRGLSRLIAGFSLAGATRAGAQPTGAYEVHLESTVRVSLRDGVRLATDVYRPARGGKPLPGRLPAILERTPHGRDVTSFRDITQANPKTRAEVAALYVARGYVVVFQACRGSATGGACVKTPKQPRILTISPGGRDEAVCRG